MKIKFPKSELHYPQCFIINAEKKILGRLATKVIKLLIGKETSFFTPGINQGNFVIILNASKIKLTGKKLFKKYYYYNSQRPGGLKKELLFNKQKKFASHIIEKTIYKMLPKGILGRQYYKRLFVYSTNIVYKF